MIKICLLAPYLTILKDEKNICFPTAKTRKLLTYLLVNRGRYCSRDKIAFSFWDEVSEERAKKNLNTSLWQLKKMFKDNEIDITITGDSDCLTIKVNDNILLDIDTFYHLLEKARQEKNLPGRINYYNRAVKLAGKKLLSEEDELWLYPEKTIFARLYREAVLDCISLYTAVSRYNEAINLCKNVLASQPFDDSFSYQLIKLYHLSENNIAALKFYQLYKKHIKEELGVEPDTKFKKLINQIKSENYNEDKEKNKKVTGFYELQLQIAPLIGRKREISQVQEYFQKTITTNRLSHIIIKGRSGTGKTRLLEEIELLSRFYGIKAINLECDKISGTPAFSLASKLIEITISQLTEEEISEIPDVHKKILSLFTPVIDLESSSVIDPLDPEEFIKNQSGFSFLLIFKAVEHILKMTIKNSPLLIVIDNLHWCDSASLNLLEYITSNFKDEALVLVTAGQTKDTPDNLHHFLNSARELSDHIYFHEIELNSLSKKDLIQFLHSILNLEQNTLNVSLTDLAEKLFLESGGIPLIFIETLKFWERQNIITFDESRKAWIYSRPDPNFPDSLIEIDPKTAFPERLRNIYQTHLSSFDQSIQRIINIAAVLGFYFEKNIISQLVKMEEEKIITALAELISQGVFLKSKEKDRLQFSHIKLREYVYQSMNSMKRKYYHKDIFSLYQKINNPVKLNHETLTQLAFHAYKGEIWREALEFNLLLGEFLLQEGNIPQSIYYLNKTEEIVNKIKIREVANLTRLYLASGKCYLFLGEGEKAEKYLTKTLKLSLEDNNKQVEEKVYSLLAQLYTKMGAFDVALNNIEKFLGMNNWKSTGTVLNCLLAMSHISLMTNNITLSREVRTKLEKITQQIPFRKDNYILGRAYFILGQHNILLFDNFLQALDLFKKAELIFRNMQKIEDLALTLSYQGSCCFYYGINESWSNKYLESLKYCQENISKPHIIALIIGPMITTYLLKGDYGKVLELSDNYPLHQDYLSWQIPYLAVNGEVYYWLQDKDQAWQFINFCLECCQKVKVVDYENHATATLGLINGSYEDYNEGLLLLEKAENQAKAIPFSLRLSRVIQKKMLLALNTGNIETLQLEADKLLAASLAAKMPFLQAWAYYGKGIVELLNLKQKSARELLTRALNLARDNEIWSLTWRVENKLADLAVIDLDILTAAEHYQKASSALKKIASGLPGKELKETFLQQKEIEKIIRRIRNIGETGSLENEFLDMLKIEEIPLKGEPARSYYSPTSFEEKLVAVLGNKTGKVKKRRYQVALMILESRKLIKPLYHPEIAENFGVHTRTIQRDLKNIRL